MPAFRFGVSAGDGPGREGSGRDGWRATARRAEAAGFDTLLMADHLADGMLTPLTALAVAAEATTRIRVGTLVLNNDFRHPVVLAREVATLDVLTEGRVELGLGAGHMKHEYDQVGLAFDPPSVRVARMSESADIMRRLWAGGDVSFAGEHYRVDGHRCFPTPVQRPIPLLIGGNGRRVLTAAARLADIVGFTGFSQVEGDGGVNPSHFTADGLAAKVGWVRSAAGDRFDRLELSVLVQAVTLTDDRRAAAEEVRIDPLTVDDILSSPYILIGTVRQVAEQLEERRAALGISYITVFEKDLEVMAQVMEQL
ncbi:MAG: TIGR03621 family F420-dependent LLM class oxidoreductase [Acidimicrobiales bacterium]